MFFCYTLQKHIHVEQYPQVLLVAVLFEVFLVAVVLKHNLWVTVDQPVCILQLRWTQLVLQLLAFTTPRDRSRQTWTGKMHFITYV